MENRMLKGRTIGLIIEDISVDYSKEIIHSVKTALAGYRDIRLVVLAGIHDEVKIREDSRCCYKAVHNLVYRLEEQLSLDGLILTLPNISGIDGEDVFDERYSRFAKLPKVFVSTGVENSVTVRYDNERGIREAVDCLVNVKGVRRMCMLGGRDDNADAQDRKQIFIKCLEQYQIPFTDDMYERTDMSIEARAEAERLMNRNPDTEAIFCVNDQVAVPLYEVLKERGLMPGRDVQVFGFDNTRFSGHMDPPLASIGADGATLGQRAVELLLRKMKGEEVTSVVLPTRLYGKESLEYEMYEYTTLEMLRIETPFIYRMFDDCFYRYASETRDPEAVDLRRLFYEFISRMLRSMVASAMTSEEFLELKRLIAIFFENGAMKFTDPARLVRSIERLQNSMNKSQKSVSANLMNNRCFAYMKDKAILALAGEINRKDEAAKREREQLQDFFVQSMQFEGTEPVNEETVAKMFDRILFPNAALLLFEEPIKVSDNKGFMFPETVRLMCVVRDGELRVLSPARRLCAISELMERTELPKCQDMTFFPAFYGNTIFGFVLAEMNESIANRGEFVASQIGRALAMNREK